MLPIYHMATMPPRIEALKDSIPSILPQCKHLFVYLNNFNGYVPPILKHRKITLFFSENEVGDLGDVGKFYQCDDWEPGYHFTVDDKLIYTKHYSTYMISKIEKYKRKAAISLHGRNFHKRKTKSYYWDFKDFFCVYFNTDEHFVHEVGTGVLAFHTDTFQPKMEWFPHLNMTDIYFSLALQKMNIPMVIAAHHKGDVRCSNRHDDSYSIHATCNKNDQFQTDVINSFKWKLNRL